MGAARPVGLRLIAGFKFVKAAVLVVAGVGALRLLSPERAAWALEGLDALSRDLHHRLVGRLAGHAVALMERTTPQQFGRFGAGALLFATLYVVQGVGLAQARRWAEFLTVAVTSSFLIVEAAALWHRWTSLRFAIIVLNVVVVLYLLGQLRSGGAMAARSAPLRWRRADRSQSSLLKIAVRTVNTVWPRFPSLRYDPLRGKCAGVLRGVDPAHARRPASKRGEDSCGD